ncbi:MAG: hypothetical protein GY820_44320 [Gammaproteobacteria bacterium]|nr:hypothetical protein [Gammaproteobacteria bacterium]
MVQNAGGLSKAEKSLEIELFQPISIIFRPISNAGFDFWNTRDKFLGNFNCSWSKFLVRKDRQEQEQSCLKFLKKEQAVKKEFLKKEQAVKKEFLKKERVERGEFLKKEQVGKGKFLKKGFFLFLNKELLRKERSDFWRTAGSSFDGRQCSFDGREKSGVREVSRRSVLDLPLKESLLLGKRGVEKTCFWVCLSGKSSCRVLLLSNSVNSSYIHG